ncbi:MAG: histidinol phosphatase [Candidatus Marinimicrobia bacterium]|nr:histidinol phosphatase [Candidatus Neomarinimicrobiota bacterium]|tara:strand:- start:18713 stop:19444 length:732 start_codon:yes stop_codon:yes gene_type:complete
MFSIFKKNKPKLSELIPVGFVDIHSHILSNIDDGPKTVDDSVYLVNQMDSLGLKKIICTPHTFPGLYNNTNSTIELSYNKLIEKVQTKMDIEYASEYMLDFSIIDRMNKTKLLTLKEDYVLVEMSFISPPVKLYDILFELQVHGYKIILAHPERYSFFYSNFNEYIKLKKIGVEFQLNLLSTVDYYGNDVRKISDKLLKNNMIDYVGTDIHTKEHISSIKNSILKISEISKLKEAIENNSKFI